MTLPRKIDRAVKFPRPKREREFKTVVRCAEHREWIREQACCVPGCGATNIVCAHVRTGTDGGAGLKPSDFWTISLCWPHHGEQTHVGEPAFEIKHGIDMKALAREFASRSPHRKKWNAA